MSKVEPNATQRSASGLDRALSILLCVFVVAEVNYPRLSPHAELAIFAFFGLTLCFLRFPAKAEWSGRPASRWLDRGLAAAAALCCGYIFVQSDPIFESFWLQGLSLGNRAGQEAPTDFLVGAAGLALVLEATRRLIGWTLPLVAMGFLLYARLGPVMPDWLFPHRGYGWERIVAQSFLHSQGVFGVALSVMFTYVFLFVVLGAVLEASGATRFVVDFAQRLFHGSSGGSAKVAVVSSGLMGSLSGSAVANTATVGPFTIPMMRSAGFSAHVAAGIEAAASSGGALAPPVMGAAAYMMLELVDPPVTYLEIIRAAVIPAVLYYLSLLFLVHFHAKGMTATRRPSDEPVQSVLEFEAVVFLGALGSLLFFLLLGYTPFRAVTLSLAGIVLVGAFNARTRLGLKKLTAALLQSASATIPLICAAACVGIVIGVATLTGIGTKLPSAILPLAQSNLFLALTLIMLSSIVLGMGLPSAVCYLLLATLIGPLLKQLGVVPLAAHFFIFYYGMMSMVTPPVALAAYAGATIAGARIMPSAFAAFRFALVGFTLPYMFVFRPQLLLLSPDGEAISLIEALPPALAALLGVFALAAGLAGHFAGRLKAGVRLLFFGAAALLLLPANDPLFVKWGISYVDLAGAAVLATAALLDWRARKDN